MNKRGQGRKPLPTRLKLLKGEKNKDRINDNEPNPEPITPYCPRHLSKEAKKEWRRIAKVLQKLGILTEIDGAALAAYCQCYGRWVEAEKKIQETNSLIYKTTNGNIIINPFVSIANRAMEQMRQFLTEFGMSPSSRSRIVVDSSKKPKSSYEKWKNRSKKN